METPPPQTVQLSATAASRSSVSARLTVERVTRAIRTNKRLLALVVLLVVGSPVLGWWVPLPGAASVSVGVAFGAVASLVGYFAITKVIERTITE